MLTRSFVCCQYTAIIPAEMVKQEPSLPSRLTGIEPPVILLKPEGHDHDTEQKGLDIIARLFMSHEPTPLWVFSHRLLAFAFALGLGYLLEQTSKPRLSERYVPEPWNAELRIVIEGLQHQ